MTINELTQVIVDAFDVDAQLFVGRVLASLRTSPTGDALARWAADHPRAFNNLLRGVSAAAQRLPRDRSALQDFVRDQLARLPVEVHRNFVDAAGPAAAPVSPISLAETADAARRLDHQVASGIDALTDSLFGPKQKP